MHELLLLKQFDKILIKSINVGFEMSKVHLYAIVSSVEW